MQDLNVAGKVLPKESVMSFFDFVCERQMIYHRKEVLRSPPPWTEDEVLSSYKFCNIFRELDAGTKLIMEAKGASDLEMFVNIVCYRFFNRRDHFERIGWIDLSKWSNAGFVQRVEAAKEQGPVFSDAYLVHGSHRDVADRIDWIVQRGDDLLARLREGTPAKPKKGETKASGSYRVLKEIAGVGDFLAYQIWLDCSYHGLHPFDGNDHVVIGPGSKWGLGLMMNLEDPKSLKDDWCVSAMVALREAQGDFFEELAKQGKVFMHDSPLGLDAVEHALCEWRKHHNLKAGTGKKRLFRAGG
jgi:hypothetical protein